MTKLYSHLDNGCIRLLCLHKDADSCQAGTLEVFALDEAPAYYALSYCWGSNHQHVSIQINTNILNVNPELYAGIRRLKQLSLESLELDQKVEYVWIDKICINQDDTREREVQVQLMGRIYSQSVRTVIWLGPDKLSCHSAWTLIDQIYDLFRSEYPAALSLTDMPMRLYSDSYHAASGLPNWDSTAWEELRTLLGLPWFTRIWVVQEVVLSSRDPFVVYGMHVHSWTRFAWTATWLRRSGYLRLTEIPKVVLNIDSIGNLRRSQVRWPLDVLLFDTSHKFHATDQRDKIFGLLGLAAETHDASNMPEALRPDYHLDVEAIYRKTALFLFQQKCSLSTMTRISAGCGSLMRDQRMHNLKSLPTWVPDWSDFATRATPSLSWVSYSTTREPATLQFPQHYLASSGLPADFLDTVNDTTLRISGILADQVTQTIRFGSERLSKARLVESLALSITGVWKMAAPLIPKKGISTWVDHIIRVTTADQHELGGRDRDQVLKDGSAYLYEFILKDGDGELAMEKPFAEPVIVNAIKELSEGGDPEAYAALAANYCFNRTFVITLAGKMGIGPIDSQSGDNVAILYGGQIPYIIRRREPDWALLGESYIEGLMSGEAIRSRDQGDLVEQIFHFQ